MFLFILLDCWFSVLAVDGNGTDQKERAVNKEGVSSSSSSKSSVVQLGALYNSTTFQLCVSQPADAPTEYK